MTSERLVSLCYISVYVYVYRNMIYVLCMCYISCSMSDIYFTIDYMNFMGTIFVYIVAL